MKKETLKRMAAAALAFAVAASGSSVPSVVQAQSLLVRSQSETQMASDKEAVYVNTYSATARELDFNENWKFYLGDASGAGSKTYDDSTWKSVTLPHDYSIEQEYTAAGEAESAFLLGGTGWYRKHFNLTSDMQGKEIRIDFDGVYMDSTIWVNGHELGTHPYGYTPFSFDITDYVTFDEENVITVKVNHQTPSSRWYSGSGIYRDVTLTVMDKVHVDLYGTEITTPNLETEKDGTVNMTVKTTVKNESTDAADVVLVHTIYEKGTNNSIGTVTTPAQSVGAGTAEEITATLPAEHPKLWSVKNPNLYTVTTQVKVGDSIVDTYDTEFGFRYFNFDSNTGFSLNGEKMKLKGVCMHHDQGALGSEAYAASIRRQVKLLKEMGCNSIRITHNPGADVMIQACNEFGMLVIEEAFDGWMYSKNGNSYDYARFFNKKIGSGNAILGGSSEMTWSEFDLTAMINRDYNAPSIIMWSLGNEVWEGAASASDAYVDQSSRLAELAKNLDITRGITIGDNKLKQDGGENKQDTDPCKGEINRYSAGMATVLDQLAYKFPDESTKKLGVIGANYCDGSKYDLVHKWFPNTMLYGSETASHTNSRGVYNTTSNFVLNQDKELTSYDYSHVGWGASASNAWYTVIQRDFVAGEYVWTGFDYLGEPTPANGLGSGWTSGVTSPKNSYFGIIDTAGLPKDNYYFYQSQWNEDVTTLHVLPAWNQDVVVSGQVPIVVYSNAAAVELFFIDENGAETSLGKKEFTEKETSAGFTYQIYEGEGKYTGNATHQNLYLTWEKAFERGTIKAVAYDKAGNMITDTVGRSMVKTTGTEAKLQASVDRTEITADGKDLAYITVDVTDSNGNIVPDASNNVKFTVEGDGVLVGVDNGRSSDHQSFQDDNRNAFSGSLVAIVQSTKNAGSFKVTATSNGLESASITVTTTADSTETTAERKLDFFYMSKNYYVKSGSTVSLPATLEAHYTDNTTETVNVSWATPSETASTYSVIGTINEKYHVSVIVHVIDEVADLLNYSTTTPVGQAPVLPSVRPAVMADGEILDVSFPVSWDTVSEASYAQAGTFTVNGSADVLGKAIDVTATVRVQDETISISGSVDDYLKLEQNVPAEKQSDTLTAIWNGETEIGSNTSGGPNPTAWTNYTHSQDGNTTAEITFSYATQQRIGEIVIHFFKDSWSARYPEAGNTKILISEDGSNWNEFAFTETIGTESNNVKPYTYSFTPITATYVKFCITNTTQATGTNAKACTGITEIEIKKAVGSFSTNTTAELSSLTVNGTQLTENELSRGAYYTLETSATVTATPADNAAVTILPFNANDKKIDLIIESEDHMARSTFTVYLERETPLDPSDSTNDYPLNKITYSTGSQQNIEGNEGPISLAFDNNSNTYWHSEWSPSWYNQDDCAEHLWVQFDFPETVESTAIRYLARGGNGDITGYRVEGKANADASWEVLTEGNWVRNEQEWYVAQFNPKKVVSLRLIVTASYADTAMNKFASAKELRVVGTGLGGPGSNNGSGSELTIVPGENYPVAGMTGTAGSSHSSHGTSLALDGNNATYWSTNWGGSVDNTGKLWYQLELQQPAKIDQLLYRPRYEGTNLVQGQQNGFVSKYKVEVKLNADDDWIQVASNNGSEDTPWTPAEQWYTADFDAIEAKYIRFTGLETLTNGLTKNTDMTIAELRVRVASSSVNKSSLEALLAEADNLIEANYTPNSWSEFQRVLSASRTLFESSEATQDEIDAQVRSLTAAKEALMNRADKTDLNAAIAGAANYSEADYTPKSWAAFAGALQHAKTASTDPNATQSSVDIAKNALNDKIQNLVVRTERTDLEDKLEEANTLQSSNYSADSWNAFQTALANATIVFNDANATEQQVASALSSLQAAMDGLVRAEVPDNGSQNSPSNTPDNSSKNDAENKPDNSKNNSEEQKNPANNTGSSNKQPAAGNTAATGNGAKTGDSSSAILWTMVMLSMAAFVTVMRKRSR